MDENTATTHKGLIVILIPKWIIHVIFAVITPILVLFVSMLYVGSRHHTHPIGLRIPEGLKNILDLDGTIMFDTHDVDGDGYISPLEFVPVSHQLIRLISLVETHVHVYDTIIDPEDTIVSLESVFSPLDLNSLSNLDQWNNNEVDHFQSLKQWTEASIPVKKFGTSQFVSTFLPVDDIVVGRTYYIIETARDVTFSSSRYSPPKLERSKEIFIHNLLTMFHPRLFIYTRFGPQGAVAIVRAVSDGFIDVHFRIHAEFQLNEPPLQLPFWFTPAHFSGHMLLSRHDNSILQFTMSVPTERKLNVDLEWIVIKEEEEEESMEVDIGRIPLMELHSVHTPVSDGSSSVHDSHTFHWSEEITTTEAAKRLSKTMYPFTEVPYYNVSEAFALAAREDKLVHVILLWGALDDQSC